MADRFPTVRLPATPTGDHLDECLAAREPDLCERCGWERGTSDGCCNTGTRVEETCL